MPVSLVVGITSTGVVDRDCGDSDDKKTVGGWWLGESVWTAAGTGEAGGCDCIRLDCCGATVVCVRVVSVVVVVLLIAV